MKLENRIVDEIRFTELRRWGVELRALGALQSFRVDISVDRDSMLAFFRYQLHNKHQELFGVVHMMRYHFSSVILDVLIGMTQVRRTQLE